MNPNTPLPRQTWKQDALVHADNLEALARVLRPYTAVAAIADLTAAAAFLRELAA